MDWKLVRSAVAVAFAAAAPACQTLSQDRLSWPTVDYRTVSCDDLEYSAETLRREIRRLTTPRDLSGDDVAAAVLYGPLWLYYLPFTLPFAVGVAAENDARLTEYRRKLSEFEQAMRDNDCVNVPPH